MAAAMADMADTDVEDTTVDTDVDTVDTVDTDVDTVDTVDTDVVDTATTEHHANRTVLSNLNLC